MIRQRSLFDTPPSPRARATDNLTSHLAANKARGRAARQRETILAWVTAHPGRTAAEIAKGVEMERHAPSRRLPELRELGLVVNGPVRECRVMKSKAMTWKPGETP